MSPTLAELVRQIENQIAETSPRDAAAILGELEHLRALVWMSLMNAAGRGEPPAETDRLLTADEAAPLLGLTIEQLSRRRRLPFRKPLGRRTVRYSLAGITKWLVAKRA